MPENSLIITTEASSVNPSNDVTGQISYEQTRKELRDFIQKRREIERALAAQEEIIIKKEQEYLEETPVGNIIIGFDNYTRGGLVSGRRRGREEEEREQRLRIFSRSSISWNSNAEQPDIDHNTQNSKAANTALSGSSQKAEGINNTTSTATGSTSKSMITKKNKKGVEDSESDGRDQKKARVNFGVVRR
ncbi:Chromatin modification-related protein eaf6 [Golovinomyces cichoracearum]|uniref:Chromatin modification-related protein EAF6 n=1 Tax=Golovinomyces cichoracearum TaxID=62708 RepID=A0A420I688_9PEZI|nr:Chromatin modification-related protein eaf6 [Golovinomyces cichoracearum]